MSKPNVDISSPCAHVGPDTIRHVDRPAKGCKECLEHGGHWVHLRYCLVCGHVGCCDSSPGKHATAHFRGTGHPLVTSAEPGEDWAWCYQDDRPLS